MLWREIKPRAGILVGLAALVMVALAWRFWAGDDALARIQASGTIRIGYAVEAPYAMVAPDGRVTGQSPELARLVAARMGIGRVEWVQTGFDTLLPQVAEGRFDVIAAGVFITPQRRKLVVFSKPTVTVAAGIGTLAAASRRYASYGDLVGDPSVRVAVLAGSVEEGALLARGMSPKRLVRVPDTAAARAALESGKVAVLALSMPALQWMIDDGAAFVAAKVAGRTAAADPARTFDVGFVFAHGEERLLAAWNAAQDEVKTSPAYLDAIARFGFHVDDLAGSPPP